MADTFNFSLRMPEDLGNTIYDLSKSDKRPMNTTIVLLLEYALREKTRKRTKNGKKDIHSLRDTSPGMEA